MKKCFPILGLLLILFGACNSGNSKEDAIKYNDKIINEQSKVIKLTLDMVAMMDKDLEKSKKLREDIVKQTEASIKVIEDMEPFDNNGKLRDAGLALFSFYKKVYSTEYKTMFEILDKGANITEEDIAVIQDMQTSVTMEESKVDAAFKEAQQEFAKKYGFEIAPSELQDDIDNIQ